MTKEEKVIKDLKDLMKKSISLGLLEHIEELRLCLHEELDDNINYVIKLLKGKDK